MPDIKFITPNSLFEIRNKEQIETLNLTYMENKPLEQQLNELRSHIKQVKLFCWLGLIICVMTISVANYFYFKNRKENYETNKLQRDFIEFYDKEFDEIFCTLSNMKDYQSIHCMKTEIYEYEKRNGLIVDSKIE